MRTCRLGSSIYTGICPAAASREKVKSSYSDFTVEFNSTELLAKVRRPTPFTTTVSRKPVLTYLWEFGDGKTGVGPTPSHTYTKAGTFTVTLVLFSGVGSAFPGRGAAPIFTKTISVS